MSKIAQYLQEHLLGEVTDDMATRKHFSQDASILKLLPSLVIYPRNENDVRKVAHFSWQLAQRGRILPLIARGGGTNTSGAAIGSGAVLIFPAHMNRILALDPKKESLTVEPGATYDKVEQTLYTHGLFLPPYPASISTATIGGGIASDTVGEKSVKYGSTRNYVERLKVVLANGEATETGPLSKRELNQKLGLTGFEGEVYRQLDKLLEENAELIEQEQSRTQALRNAVGYKLWGIKQNKHFDLTPLFVGSQGTLGIITEATLRVVPHNPVSHLALVSLEKLEDLDELLPKILELNPSICDMVNRSAIDMVRKLNPAQLLNTLDRYDAAVHLFVEFDDFKDAKQKQEFKTLKKLCEKIGAQFVLAGTPDEQEKLWKVRQSVSTIIARPSGQAKSIPVAEDVSVPTAHLRNFLQKAEKIYQEHDLEMPAWGSAGDGVIRLQPSLRLGAVGDRQKLFKITDAVYRLAIENGGSLTASAGDGRTRAPYAFWQYSPEYYQLMMDVKKIFDPHGMLNPGVKTAKFEDVKSLLRSEYDLSHHYNHSSSS